MRYVLVEMKARSSKSDNRNALAGDRVMGDARAALGELRDATRALVEGAPGRVGRAADLHRALDVDAPLGWQIYRIAIASDPLSTLPFVPRAGSMQRVLRQARERGWDESVVRKVAQAYEHFNEFVERTSGSRGNFDALIASFENEASGQIRMSYRAAAFRANARVWGIRARTDYRAVIFQEGSKPGSETLSLVHGRVDVQSSRPNAVLALRRGVIYDMGGAPVGSLGTTSVLEEFCSKPCPRLETLKGTDGESEVLRLDLLETGTPATFFGHQLFPNWGAGEPQTCWGVKALSTVPAEVLLIDFLVPRAWIDPRTARVSVHGNLADMHSVYVDSETFTIPAKEQVRALGSDLQAMHTPDVPRCPELVGKMLASLNCTPGDFEILRCRVRYPILHSLTWPIVSAPQ